MNVKKIWYKEIKKHGFTESEYKDAVYLDQYGFDWVVYTKKLSKSIYIEWSRETGYCIINRLKNVGKDSEEIARQLPIRDASHLDSIIDFHLGK